MKTQKYIGFDLTNKKHQKAYTFLNLLKRDQGDFVSELVTQYLTKYNVNVNALSEESARAIAAGVKSEHIEPVRVVNPSKIEIDITAAVRKEILNIFTTFYNTEFIPSHVENKNTSQNGVITLSPVIIDEHSVEPSISPVISEEQFDTEEKEKLKNLLNTF